MPPLSDPAQKALDEWASSKPPTAKCQRHADKLLADWGRLHPKVSDLLVKHGSCVAALKQHCSDVIEDPNEQDDLWLLVVSLV
jgi:hypothetical protein